MQRWRCSPRIGTGVPKPIMQCVCVAVGVVAIPYTLCQKKNNLPEWPTRAPAQIRKRAAGLGLQRQGHLGARGGLCPGAPRTAKPLTCSPSWPPCLVTPQSQRYLISFLFFFWVLWVTFFRAHFFAVCFQDAHVLELTPVASGNNLLESILFRHRREQQKGLTPVVVPSFDIQL